MACSGPLLSTQYTVTPLLRLTVITEVGVDTRVEVWMGTRRRVACSLALELSLSGPGRSRR